MGADKIKISDNGVNDMKKFSATLEKAMADTLKDGEKLLKSVESSDWKGDSRNAVVSYLDIVTSYHKQLHDVSKEQKKIFGKLQDYLNDFEKEPDVQKVKKL